MQEQIGYMGFNGFKQTKQIQAYKYYCRLTTNRADTVYWVKPLTKEWAC